MSVKIMGLIWDLDLESNKKFVLLAYADHANHEGGSIWPAVNTIVKKTGYHERSVQRITRELEESGYLVADGEGPKGTNRWRIPLNQTGDKIAPLARETKTGDIALGDIALGDILAPELTTIIEPSLTEITKSANKTVDAVLKFAKVAEEKLAKRETWPHREKFPDAIRELLDMFVKLTGQHPSKDKVMEWLSTGQDWLDLGIIPDDLMKAYQKSKPDEKGFGGFTVGRPGSLTNTANMFAGERRTNGQPAGGMDKYERALLELERITANG